MEKEPKLKVLEELTPEELKKRLIELDENIKKEETNY